MGNGTTDADGAQARGVKGVSDVQGAQVVGGNGSMVSGGIVGAESQLGAAEDVGAGTVEAESGATKERPAHWHAMSRSQRQTWRNNQKKKKISGKG